MRLFSLRFDLVDVLSRAKCKATVLSAFWHAASIIEIILVLRQHLLIRSLRPAAQPFRSILQFN